MQEVHENIEPTPIEPAKPINNNNSLEPLPWYSGDFGSEIGNLSHDECIIFFPAVTQEDFNNLISQAYKLVINRINIPIATSNLTNLQTLAIRTCIYAFIAETISQDSDSSLVSISNAGYTEHYQSAPPKNDTELLEDVLYKWLKPTGLVDFYIGF